MDDYEVQQRLANAIATRDVRQLEAYVLGGGGGVSHALDAQARYAYYTARFGPSESAAPVEGSPTRFSAPIRKRVQPPPSVQSGATHALPTTTRINVSSRRLPLVEVGGSGIALRQVSATPDVAPTEWTDADRRRHLIRALSPLHMDRVQQKCIVPYPRKHSRKDLWLKEHLMRQGNDGDISTGINPGVSEEAQYAFSHRSPEENMRREAERETFQYMCRTEAQARAILCKQEEYAFRGLLALAGDDVEDNVMEVRKTRERVELECEEARERRALETAQMCAFQSCLSPFAAVHLKDDFACACNRLAVAERSVRERVIGAELEERRRFLRLAARDAKTAGLGLADVVEVYHFVQEIENADDAALNAGLLESDTGGTTSEHRGNSILRAAAAAPRSVPAGLNCSAFTHEESEVRHHATALSPRQQRALVQEAVRAERALRAVREQMISSMALHEKIYLEQEFNRRAADLKYIQQCLSDASRAEILQRAAHESNTQTYNSGFSSSEESRWVGKYAKMYAEASTIEKAAATTLQQSERPIQRTPIRATRSHPNTSKGSPSAKTPPAYSRQYRQRHLPSPNVDAADAFYGSPLRRADASNGFASMHANPPRKSVNQGTSTEGLLDYRPRIHPPIDPDQECTAF